MLSHLNKQVTSVTCKVNLHQSSIEPNDRTALIEAFETQQNLISPRLTFICFKLSMRPNETACVSGYLKRLNTLYITHKIEF